MGKIIGIDLGRTNRKKPGRLFLPHSLGQGGTDQRGLRQGLRPKHAAPLHAARCAAGGGLPHYLWAGGRAYPGAYHQ